MDFYCEMRTSMFYIPIFFHKKIYVCFVFNSNFTGLFTGVGVRNIYYFGYVIFTNARVGSIRSQIFTSARVRNIISRP